MADKIKVAVSWAAACGGCDVSLLDLEDEILELADIADFVFWPVAMDFKRAELAALPDNHVDVGIFNGAIRTSEQKDDAELFRRKCKILVAYGACASFGGIPGLGNLAPPEEILAVAYATTASTENPDGVRPCTEHTINGRQLSLPAFLPWVRHLSQVVDVDLWLPGCPPPTVRIAELVALVAAYAKDGSLPSSGVLADTKALCDSCPRASTRDATRLPKLVRPHEILADASQCFLNQGLLCLGLATRGGCGHTCIDANMPCRGCFGPTPEALDPGAGALSAIGSIAGASNENYVPAHEMKKGVKSVIDPAGTFYRFTLPAALLSHTVVDKGE